MDISIPLPELDWHALVHTFAAEPGCCVLDVPDSTRDPAPARILTALPRFRETHNQCANHHLALSPRARSRPYGHGGWLPLKVGFVAYGDGEMELQAGRPATSPLFQLNEYDWLILYRPDACELTLHIAPECPQQRVNHVRARVEALQKDGLAAEDLPAFRITSPFVSGMDQSAYLRSLAHIQDYIHAGDVYQVNFAQPFTATFTGHPIHAYQALHEANPSPCSAYLDTGCSQILSLSPERFLRVQDDRVETRPIKGTRRRGRTPAEDDQLAADLMKSPKDRAENLMIVDLLRNDLGRCCRIGSVRAEPLFALETFANVHHLVSCITGELAPGLSPLDLLLSAFPGGSITGAPKRRAMEVIRELEEEPRGVYCGSFFHWTPCNGFDSTIAIRTLECRDGEITCFGGGGIVADSEPEAEYQESITKIRLFMDVLEAMT